ADGRAHLAGVDARVGAGQHRARRRIAAQLHDLLAHGRIGDVVTAVGPLGDGVGILAVAQRRARLLHGAEPGLVDELIEALGRRRRRLCARIEVRLDARRRQQVVEADAGRLRRLLDRSGHFAHAVRNGGSAETENALDGHRLPWEWSRATGRAGFRGQFRPCGIMVNEPLTADTGRPAMAETIQRHKRGGLYFEDFEVGKTYEHRYTRTVTQMDNMLFSNMTLNPQPLHIDRHFCETETEWGQPLMNSLFTLGLMIGIQVSDMTVGTTIANLGMQDVKFRHPLFEADTVHCTTEVLAKRESKSRPGAGIVEFHHRCYNQDNKLVAECRRQAFIKMQLT